VRELQSVLRQALVQTIGRVLLPESLPRRLLTQVDSVQSADRPNCIDWQAFLDDRIQSQSGNIYAEAVEAMERSLLDAHVAAYGRNQMQAAKMLGITRSNLRNKLRTLKIVIDRVVGTAEESGVANYG